MLVVLVAAACALAGCGTSTSDQVKAKVHQYATAMSQRDVATICDQVFAPTLIEAFARVGVSCERAMGIATSNVSNPTLKIGRVYIKGKTAEVIALSGATGQVSSLDGIDLIQTSGGWRITKTGDSLLPGEERKAAADAAAAKAHRGTHGTTATTTKGGSSTTHASTATTTTASTPTTTSAAATRHGHHK